MVLPKEMAKSIPKTHLLSEEEWRSIGVQQSKGWVHYMIHEPGKILTIYVHVFYTRFWIRYLLKFSTGVPQCLSVSVTFFYLLVIIF